jgi:hypothetical protein
MMTKICNKCKKEKAIKKFHKDKSKKDGFRDKCKNCCIKITKQWHNKNLKKVKNYQIEYWILNKEKLTNQAKKYRRLHKKEIFILNKNYYNKNKIEILKRNNIYKKVNKDKISKQNRKYMDNHKEEIKTYHKEYYQNNKKTIYKKLRLKFNNNMEFKISHYLRTRLNKVLKNEIKSKSVLKLLGCSIEQLKKHLQKKFKRGMSWKNYGLWHIDHIKPCASFNLSKPSEQRRCFNYKNLQPLWAKDNIRKSDKIC